MKELTIGENKFHICEHGHLHMTPDPDQVSHSFSRKQRQELAEFLLNG